MGFLDNLEDSLKSLESREERDPREAEKRVDERSRALAAAPWAEELKTAPYTRKLLDEAVIAGHRIRAKVYLAWVESTLRLEARGRTLELKPTPDGIIAAYPGPKGDIVEEPLDLQGNPIELLDRWLAGEKAPAPPIVVSEHDI